MSAVQKSGFCVHGIATGLAVGTTYWIDLSQMAVTGGSITGVSAVAIEE